MTQHHQASKNEDPKPGVSETRDESSSKTADEYSIKRRETLAEVPGMRVRLLTLLEGQNVPWHYHNHITDTFFCRRGPMHILTRLPQASHTLVDGDMLAVNPGTLHYVEASTAAGCEFMIIQGVGKYDYVPVDDQGPVSTAR
jgi:quercetin dioxygenase-like cupin family protein